MGTAKAGFDSVVEVSSDDTTYNGVGGANSHTFSRTFNELDAVDFSDTGENIILGLKNTDASISGNYDDADTGQALIETQFNAGNTIYVRVTNSNGTQFKSEFYCTSFEYTSSPDGKEEFSCEFRPAVSSWTVV